MAKSKYIIRSWETRGGPVRQKEKKFSQTLNVYVGIDGADEKLDKEYHVNVVLDGTEKQKALNQKYEAAVKEFEKKLKSF